MEGYVDFEEKFNKLIQEYKGTEDYDLVRDYSKIFSVVLGISSDKNSDGHVKMIMNSAISYFIIPRDVLSEKEMGIRGYLDDFFICIVALRQLLDYNKEVGKFLINKYWPIEEDYEDYLSNKFYLLNQKIDQKTISDIFTLSGMNFVKESICLKNNNRKYFELKTHDLQRRIQYLIFLYLNGRANISKEERKVFEEQIFGTEEFSDFSSKLDFLVNKDDKFLNAKLQVNEILSIDERLKKIRAKKVLR